MPTRKYPRKKLSTTHILLVAFTLLFSACTEPTLVQDVKNKANLNAYLKNYANGNNISTTGVDGLLMLDCGTSYNDLRTANKDYDASTHALFVDKSYYDTVLATVSVSYNNQALANPHNSGLMSAFVDEPEQTPNSINWVITNLNPQPFTVSDNPLQRIEFPTSLKAGDTVSLSGFSLPYSADMAISEIWVDIIFSSGMSFHYLGDTRTDYPPFIEKKVANTGSISFTATELAQLRKGYYSIGISYRTVELRSVAGRILYVAKSYNTSIPLLLQ